MGSRAPANPQGVPVGFADVLAILLISVPLSILLLTIGEQLAGTGRLSTLPDFIVNGGSKIWTWASGATGVIALLLRSKGRDIWRDFLRWILLTSLLCACAVLVIAFTIQRVVPATPVDSAFFLRLRVELAAQELAKESVAASEIVRFRFDQLEPINRTGYGQGFVVNASTGDVDPADVRVDLPSHGKRFLAHIVRKITESTPDREQKLWDLCFVRRSKDPEQHAESFARLNCQESAGCKVAADGDPGWIDVCPAGALTGRVAGSFGSLFVVQAAEMEQAPNSKSWNIPSLETLRDLAPERRTGYTEFQIRSETLSGLLKANTLMYDITVNGNSVLIDGLPSSSVPLPFEASKGLTFDFGLENLNFSGADGGCEHIEVAFRFAQDRTELKTVKISRLYAALRDPLSVERRGGDGSVFRWGGRYVRPASEGKTEVLAGATVNVNSARRWKSLLDSSNLSFKEQRIVGVIRAPLRQPERFGIALGLVQSNGQIRFTFTRDEATRFQTYMASVRNRAALPSNPYVYEPPSTRDEKLGYCESKAI